MESNKENSKANKGVVVLLVIVIMVLAAVLGILFSKMKDQQKESIEIQEVLRIKSRGLNSN